MNTTGAVFSLLSIVLFIFSSFDVEARRSSSLTAEKIVRKISEKANLDPAQKAELRSKTEEILEKHPDFDPTKEANFNAKTAVAEIHRKFISIEPKQGREEVPAASEFSRDSLLQTKKEQKVPVFISSARASSIVEVLSHKLGEGKVSEATKKNLIEAINKKGNEIGPSLLKLAEKVESARTEDVEVIVKFAENISSRGITSTKINKQNPADANILLDLVENLHDMPFWDAQPRTTVMSVLKTFNEKLGKKATKEDIEISLQVPGPPALNSPYSKVATQLRVNDAITVEAALMLAIIKNMVRMEDVSAYGLQTAIIMIKQRIRELCRG